MKINQVSILLQVIYLAFCIGISSFSLSSFIELIPQYISVHYDYKMEALMVLAQVGFQWVFMIKSTWLKRYQYMTVALTVSMFGAIMLLPLIVYSFQYSVTPIFALSYFFAVVLAIFIIHHRMIRKNFLPPHLTFTWLLYRCLLLLYVVYP